MGLAIVIVFVVRNALTYLLLIGTQRKCWNSIIKRYKHWQLCVIFFYV